jgi:hypothetical protein
VVRLTVAEADADALLEEVAVDAEFFEDGVVSVELPLAPIFDWPPSPLGELSVFELPCPLLCDERVAPGFGFVADGAATPCFGLLAGGVAAPSVGFDGVGALASLRAPAVPWVGAGRSLVAEDPPTPKVEAEPAGPAAEPPTPSVDDELTPAVPWPDWALAITAVKAVKAKKEAASAIVELEWRVIALSFAARQ